jgi:hypothetical protein
MADCLTAESRITPLGPEIETVIQVDIGEERRDH